MNPTPAASSESPETRARRVHEKALVLDAHIDLGPRLIQSEWRFDERHAPPPAPGADGSHMDLPRMREASIDGAFFAVFIPGTIDHALALTGPDHVGLGPDFYDSAMPHGMEDCTRFQAITEALLSRGYAETDVVKVLGGNLLRVMEQAERVGRDLRGEP